MTEKDLKKNHILPGKMVSADHYILWDMGRLYHTRGKSEKSDIFLSVCLFVDHGGGFMIIKHHVGIKATKNIKAKISC